MHLSWSNKLYQGSQTVRGHARERTVKTENQNQNKKLYKKGDINGIYLPNDEPNNCLGDLTGAE